MRLAATFAVALLTCALASPAAAQDQPFAITFGYPAAVGAQWQVRERVALRSEFTVGHSNEMNGDISLTSSGWRFGVTAGAVLSIIRDKPRHLYAVPHYEFRQRNVTLSQLMNYQDANGNFAQTTIEVTPQVHEHTVAGLIGIEFNLTDRSAVFAEGGPGYRKTIRRASLPQLPAIHSPLGFSDENLNVTENDVRFVARVGVNLRF